jgi:hypothetical protein
MTDCDCYKNLRHQIGLILSNKPFDPDPYKDGQYAGLRTVIRLMDALDKGE